MVDLNAKNVVVSNNDRAKKAWKDLIEKNLNRITKNEFVYSYVKECSLVGNIFLIFLLSKYISIINKKIILGLLLIIFAK
jgi:hypothetical protein